MLSLEQRARKAQELLDNTMLSEAFNAVAQAYVLAFRKCAPNDDRGRARYQDALNDLDAVKVHLQAAVVQGELDAKRAQEFQTPTLAQRVTRIF